MNGYAVQVGPVIYDQRKDGSPIGLAEAWREIYGVGQAVIYRPDGSVLLANAGSPNNRAAYLRHRRARQRARAAGYTYRLSPNGVSHLVKRNCCTCGMGPHLDWPEED